MQQPVLPVRCSVALRCAAHQNRDCESQGNASEISFRPAVAPEVSTHTYSAGDARRARSVAARAASTAEAAERAGPFALSAGAGRNER